MMTGPVQGMEHEGAARADRARRLYQARRDFLHASTPDIKRSVMTEKYTFSIVLEPQQEGGFTVLVPALPEVVTEGDNEEEALVNVEEAIRATLAYRRDNGIPIPSDARPEIRHVTIIS